MSRSSPPSKTIRILAAFSTRRQGTDDIHEARQMLEEDRLRWRGPIEKLIAESEIKCKFILEDIGLWDIWEPSFCLEIIDNDTARVDHFLQTLCRLLDQEAIIVIVPQKGGNGFHIRYSFEPVLKQAHSDQLLPALRDALRKFKDVGLSLQHLENGDLACINFYGSNSRDRYISNDIRRIVREQLRTFNTGSLLRTEYVDNYQVRLIRKAIVE